jgi:MoaA/NifB/PqqE/SkfB family radical SAM enzyme
MSNMTNGEITTSAELFLTWYHGMTQYKYNSPDLLKPVDLTERENFLLKESKTFCIYPWIHLHAYPTGEAYPCCHAEMKVGQVGDCRSQTLQEIWTGDAMGQLRDNMLHDIKSKACQRCYEQESAGFFSGRQSANKHHGHHIKKLSTNPFEMTYWDIRFSNLCNLSCRSCGHIFSSSWYQDQAKLAGTDWASKNRALNIAGRTANDMWEQLLPHIDYVEQIYFAGGEPLMMDEHYRILEELERRGRFDVRLIYNTNFTQVRLKDRYVFDYWKKFDSVAVGASLDAMGSRAEYIRNGTDWQQVEENRRRMIDICPNVDFYISPTLSILNAWHLPDFHRHWVDRGLIRPQDCNINILQDPAWYRLDIAPVKYKQRLRIKFEEHIEWLRGRDSLSRVTVGLQSAINFMMASDRSDLVDTFWQKTQELDRIRSQNIATALPELEALR